MLATARTINSGQRTTFVENQQTIRRNTTTHIQTFWVKCHYHPAKTETAAKASHQQIIKSTHHHINKSSHQRINFQLFNRSDQLSAIKRESFPCDIINPVVSFALQMHQ